MHWVDKRAIVCRGCAEKRYNEQIGENKMSQGQPVSDGLVVPVKQIVTHPTYDQIHSDCLDLAKSVLYDGIKFDAIVGLTRGGLVPGVLMSHMLQTPMEVVSYSSKLGAGDNRCYGEEIPVIHAKRILIVDDIADSGKTLLELVKEYDSRGHEVYTATLYYKESSVLEPNYYINMIPADAPWIIFPWEVAYK
jgi:hypothetical protein